MFRDLTGGYALGCVATSTRNTCEANWNVWLRWRTYAEKGIWLDAEAEEAEMAEELVQHTALCCAVNRDNEATVGKLVA